MKVVHLTLTPLAGAPIRIVQALNRFTNINARLINLNPAAYGARIFDEDVDFRSSFKLAHDLIEDADILHLHHWMDLERNPFGISLRHRKIVRHFHSEPEFVAKHLRADSRLIINDPSPQIVVAQFHERLYPKARPVPNLINFDIIDELVKNNKRIDGDIPKISFFPTTMTSATEDRWNTKGAPETIHLLSTLEKKLNFELDAASDLPHKEALMRRISSDIVIDEMVTGSYHLTSLEGLSLFKPTFAYLDSRMVSVLTLISGSDSLPWLNLPLHRIEKVLKILLQNHDLRRIVGEYSGQWMRKYWATNKMVQSYVEVYEEVLNGRNILRESAAIPVTDCAIPDFNWAGNMEEMISKML